MRRTPTFLLALVVSATVVATPVAALELERGDIRLVLHEESSRFSLYLRRDGGWQPLFVAEDPRTSALDVLEGNRVLRMGDAGAFAQRVEETDNGARFVWTSPTLEISQEFALTRGIRSESFDAVEVRVSITNRGEEPARVGARLLLDTYLGERSNTHFATPGSDQINREARLEPGPVNAYVASVASQEASWGLQVMLADDAVTRPQAAVLANWQRLSDSSWDYDVNETRNFNRLPYSINDSALLLIYPVEQLRSGASYSVLAQMGDLSPQGYLSPQAAAETTGANPLLERLAELVDRLNALIASDDVDPEEVRTLQAELDALADLIRGE
ncbi:MAG: hypothetical protein ACOCYX_06650 [Spirochaetota bacterium]